MSEMIERVALAIWRAREQSFPKFTQRMAPDDIDRSSGAWAAVVREARAAIAAMREPTPWMIDEACGAFVRTPVANDTRKFGVKMLHVYQRALSAALSDEPGNPETAAMVDAALKSSTHPPDTPPSE